MRHWRLRWRFRWYCCSLIYHSSWRYLRPYKPNEPQGCPTLTVTPTVKPNKPQGCPTLTVAISEAQRTPSEAHRAPRLPDPNCHCGGEAPSLPSVSQILPQAEPRDTGTISTKLHLHNTESTSSERSAYERNRQERNRQARQLNQSSQGHLILPLSVSRLRRSKTTSSF